MIGEMRDNWGDLIRVQNLAGDDEIEVTFWDTDTDACMFLNGEQVDELIHLLIEARGEVFP